MKIALFAILWQTMVDTYIALAADPSYVIAIVNAVLSLPRLLARHIKN